jgi:hypothetical protein
MTEAIILYAALGPPDPQLPWLEPLLRSLPYARRLELERLDPAARRASLAALALVLLGACRSGGRDPVPSAFEFPAGGKPRLRGGPDFSCSHSAGTVGCIVVRGIDCGIDIEDLAPAADPVSAARLWAWTATEAALKAAGLGLRQVGDVRLAAAMGAADIRGRRFQLQRVDALPGCAVHVALGAPARLRIEAVDLAGPVLSVALERCFGLATQFQ